MLLPITSIAGGILGVLVILLALRIVKLRRSLKVGIGSADSLPLELAIRVHGNAIENIPLGLLLLGLLEIQGANLWFIIFCASALVIGRALHVIGLSKSQGKTFGRFFGTITTWLMILITSGYLLVSSVIDLL
jgi:uncharacterized protein